jgi:hypothetical protein
MAMAMTWRSSVGKESKYCWFYKKMRVREMTKKKRIMKLKKIMMRL